MTDGGGEAMVDGGAERAVGGGGGGLDLEAEVSTKVFRYGSNTGPFAFAFALGFELTIIELYGALAAACDAERREPISS